MPFPGGVLALQQSLSFYPAVQRDPRRRSNSLVPSTGDINDPEYKAFSEAQRYFRENLKCTLGFIQEIISSTSGVITGVLILETRREVMHCGLFILMKGLSLPPKKRRVRSVVRAAGGEIICEPVTSLKFKVMGNALGKEEILVKAGSRESYPLELDIPEKPNELPPPLITSEGKLFYRLQTFMTTSEGRHVNINETILQYEGYYDLHKNYADTEKPVSVQLEVQSKRSYMGLGRKKTAYVDFSVGKSGFLPHEAVDFTVIGSSLEKFQVQLECRVELVQKVWYQVMPKVGRRMSVKMKVNLISVTSANKLVIEPGKEVVWEGRLLIPKGQTPTYKFDFMNSVSYTLRVSVTLNGDREGKATAEAPIFVGTVRNLPLRNGKKDHDNVGKIDKKTSTTYDDDEEDEDDFSPPSRVGAGAPLIMRPSQSLIFESRRQRAGSMSSVESFQSGRSSLFSIPPNYSELSSRRSTPDTLPPPYNETELQELSYLPEEDNANNDDFVGFVVHSQIEAKDAV